MESDGEKNEDDDGIFVFIRDSRFDLDGIIIATFEDPVFKIFTSEDIHEDFLGLIIPYMMSRYHKQYKTLGKSLGVLVHKDDPYAKRAYEAMLPYAEEITYTVAGILSCLGMRIEPDSPVEHSEATGYIPDLSGMGLEDFNRWARYFEEGWKKHKED